jgi:hypothetical protein
MGAENDHRTGFRPFDIEERHHSSTGETTMNVLFSYLGHCQSCIRKAFVSAAVAWTAAIIAYASGYSDATFLLSALAIPLTILWFGHMVGFLLRIRLAQEERVDLGRRSGFVLLGRGLAAVTMISFLPSKAPAQGYGGCGRDGCGDCFRPFWTREGSRVCWRCHSCGNDCGGQTC